MKSVMTTEELAAEIGVKPQTLRTWRSRSEGPAHFRVSAGGPVRYRRSDVDLWMEERVAASRGASSTGRPDGHSRITSPCDE